MIIACVSFTLSLFHSLTLPFGQVFSGDSLKVYAETLAGKTFSENFAENGDFSEQSAQ